MKRPNRQPLRLIAAIFLMSACAPAPGIKSTSQISREAHAIAQTAQSLRAFLSDTTSKSYSKQHGTQIEYFAPNGRSYLVYPGNTHVLAGHWTTKEGNAVFGPQICFASDTPTFNPVTGQGFYAGEWDCRSGRAFLTQFRDEIRDGDPLNLENTTKLPRVMPKGVNISIPTTAKTVGLPTNMALNKAPGGDNSDSKIGL